MGSVPGAGFRVPGSVARFKVRFVVPGSWFTARSIATGEPGTVNLEPNTEP